MHHQLYTLRPHGDVNKFEVEDGVIRGAVATLLSVRSSITEIVVDIPRDLRTDDAFELAGAADDILIAISAEVAVDAQPDMSSLSKDFATVVAFGEVERFDIAERERTWPGTATPGTAVRFRAVGAKGIDLPSLTNWVKETLTDCAEQLPDAGIHALIAGGDATGLAAVNASFSLPRGEDPANTFTSRPLKPFLESELLDSDSITANMITEHRIFPNPQIWT